LLRVWDERHKGTIEDVFIELDYEQERPVKNGDTVVDGGAGIGTFTVKASLRADLVYAFEPKPENYKFLEINTKGIDHIIISDKALWSTSGLKKILYMCDGNWGGNSLYPIPEYQKVSTIQVETVCLDDVIDGRVDFLKLDVEVAELETLKGAKEILHNYQPFIAVELHTQELYWKVQRYLSKYNYRMIRQQGNLCNYGTFYFEGK